MKNKENLLCNSYTENLKNLSRTDKIGASNHLEMIEEEPRGADQLRTVKLTCPKIQVTGSGLDKNAAEANKEMIEEQPKTVFKVYDIVYDSTKSDEQGIVREIDKHIVHVIFGCEDVYYNLEGVERRSSIKTLSFKPYNIDVCQERPKPTIKKGTLVYCWDNSNPESVFIGLYKRTHRDNHAVVSFLNQLDNEDDYYIWNNASLTNPLKD